MTAKCMYLPSTHVGRIWNKVDLIQSFLGKRAIQEGSVKNYLSPISIKVALQVSGNKPNSYSL